MDASPDFQEMILNPTISKEDKKNVIFEISKQNNFNLTLNKFLGFVAIKNRLFFLKKIIENFLNFLVMKRRFFYVEKILKDFVMICSKNRGEISAKLIVAKELNENEISKIKNDLSQTFGSDIKLNYNYDPDLIGGLIMQVESIMIDTSVKTKLKKLEKGMLEV